MLNNTLLMINYYLESLFCCCYSRQYNRASGGYYKYGKTYRYQSLKKIIKNK